MNSLSVGQRADFAYCQALQKRHGKSYYFATRFFPQEQRLATFALYAFFRVPDDLVDEDHRQDPLGAARTLEAWREEWRKAYAGFPTSEPVLRATAWVFHQFQIPYEYSESFLEAMLQDTRKQRYETYDELRAYMYGSAVVVGLMMTHVIGFSDPKALVYAQALGEAMQLTNFLRDIRDDFRDRNRIYLPRHEWEAFGVTERHFQEHLCDEHWSAFMQFQIQRCDALYEEAQKGIPLLYPSGRTAVAIASRLYQEILRKIERMDYHIFVGRARTSTWEKIFLSFQTWKNL